MGDGHTEFRLELKVDLGEIGDLDTKRPFHVRLSSAPLAALIDHARQCHRVYELLLIDRPGDAWDYVSVIPLAVPARIALALQRFADDCAAPVRTDGAVPLPVFDALFSWRGDDTSPEDEAWLQHRGSPSMLSFARQLFDHAQAVVQQLRGADPIIAHICEGSHSCDRVHAFLPRVDAIKHGRRHAPNPPDHTPDFYAALATALSDPAVRSVSYRATGDHRVMRMLAAEQRRRADAFKLPLSEMLNVHARVERRISNDAWGSEIWFHTERLGNADLWIEGGGMGGASIKSLVETGRRLPTRYILSAKDEGDIVGYQRSGGDGWVLYRSQ